LKKSEKVYRTVIFRNVLLFLADFLPSPKKIQKTSENLNRNNSEIFYVIVGGPPRVRKLIKNFRKI